MRTSRRIPRSAMVRAGISGSGIAPAALRISSTGVTRAPRGTSGGGAASQPACTQTARAAVPPAPPPASGRLPCGFRYDQRGVVEDVPDIPLPLRAKLVRFWAHAHCGRVAGHRVALEKLGGERPQGCKRALHAAMTFVGAVAEAKSPVGGVVTVVCRLLHRLGRDGRDLPVCGGGERLPLRELKA